MRRNTQLACLAVLLVVTGCAGSSDVCSACSGDAAGQRVCTSIGLDVASECIAKCQGLLVVPCRADRASVAARAMGDGGEIPC